MYVFRFTLGEREARASALSPLTFKAAFSSLMTFTPSGSSLCSAVIPAMTLDQHSSVDNKHSCDRPAQPHHISRVTSIPPLNGTFERLYHLETSKWPVVRNVSRGWILTFGYAFSTESLPTMLT